MRALGCTFERVTRTQWVHACEALIHVKGVADRRLLRQPPATENPESVQAQSLCVPPQSHRMHLISGRESPRHVGAISASGDFDNCTGCRQNGRG